MPPKLTKFSSFKARNVDQLQHTCEGDEKADGEFHLEALELSFSLEILRFSFLIWAMPRAMYLEQLSNFNFSVTLLILLIGH